MGTTTRLLAVCLLLSACIDSRPPRGAVDGGDDGGTVGDAGPRDLSVVVPPDFGGLDSGCGLRSCQSVGANCGPIGDGCGGTIDCGTCPTGQTCGGGGTPSVCGTSCVAKSCSDLNFNCGAAGDGCGNLIQCGTCPTGQVCGLSSPNVCGTGSGDGGMCMPKTCGDLGFNCGPAGDGCGNTIQCGTCPQGQLCGGGGKPGVCGGGCTPKTCSQLGFNCGMAGDGCGNAINCGMCSGGQVCGGGGQANVCGSMCTNLCKQQVACDMGSTTISGTVLAPTDSTKGYGNPDPLPNALVYVPNGTVQPFSNGVSCGSCGMDVTGEPLVSVNSGTDGKFVLPNAPCGQNIPLVIQLGRWRRHIIIPSVSCCGNTQLTADQTRFPRTEGEGGDALNNIPKIAIQTGAVDPMECVLLKIGVDVSQFTNGGGGGRVELYQGTGCGLQGRTLYTIPSGATLNSSTTLASNALWPNAATLAQYDAVIAECTDCDLSYSGVQTGTTPNPYKPANLTNLLNYANNGGRLFASHFSFIWLYTNGAFANTAQWMVDQTHLADTGGPYTADIDTSFARGKTFASWLQTVGASSNGTTIPISQERRDFNAVNTPSLRWLYLDAQYASKEPSHPLEYTFDTPVGATSQCGRVLFSDFHVNATTTCPLSGCTFPTECGSAAPLTAQEKVLEYMLFDLTSCVQPSTSTCTPKSCSQLGYNCGAAGDTCGNIQQCGTCPTGQVCGAQQPNVCGTSCFPLTCAQQNIACGPAGDGCGNLLQCGTCPSGQTCGGGGVPGQCGTGSCTPLTCSQLGIMCGPAGDGCGNSIDCGTCPQGQTCGGGGKSGQCGTPICTPTTCAAAGANCGTIADGCGGSLSCGTCPTGQTCGGTGMPNVCGGIG